MNSPLSLAWQGVQSYLASRRAGRTGFSFAGKNVVITGGSRGLGLVMARQLVDAGARVVVCSRDRDELGRAADDLSARGGQVLALRCDVTDPESVRELVRSAESRLGPTDVLINDAGVITVGPLETMTLADFEQAMKTHFWGSLHTILEVLPGMRRRRAGRIVNVTSIGARVPIPHLVPYVASKFAQYGLSSALRAELAGDGVVVTTVCPGLMRTGSHINAEFHGQNQKEYAWFALGDSIPGMSMSAEEAARQILDACARGDAEITLTVPAKLAVIAQGLVPSLVDEVAAAVNHFLLPGPGGIGTETRPGKESRGLLPAFLTILSDRAAEQNNEREARRATRQAP